jgi:hypothetical protein
MHTLPQIIRESQSFQPHASCFSHRLAPHLLPKINGIHKQIRHDRNASIIAGLWAATLHPTDRTLAILNHQTQWRKGGLDEQGEIEFKQKVDSLFDGMPTLSPLAKWAGASAHDSWTGIKHIAEMAAERAHVMCNEILDELAEKLNIPGHREARRLKMRDPLWLRRQIRRDIRRYRETGWFKLAPLQYDRASPDGKLDSEGQDAATDKFLEKFGDLVNKQTGKIISLPCRAEQTRKRQAELICRQRGLIDQARNLGFSGYMVTFTCPSKYHPTKTLPNKTRIENERFDRELTPIDGHRFLLQQFSALGRWAAKRDIVIFGLRAAHPHQDGTPHHHFVMLIHPSEAGRVEQYLKARFKARGVTQIDFQQVKGGIEGAMAYCSAYLCASNSQATNTAVSYQAWRRAWGFREFSLFEIGAGKRQRGLISAWRLLRKKYRDREDELSTAIRTGRWNDFRKICKAKHLALVYTERVNAYNEIKPALAGLMLDGHFIDAASEWRPKWLRTRPAKEGGRDLVEKNQENPNKTAPDQIAPVTAPASCAKWVNWPPPPDWEWLLAA